MQSQNDNLISDSNSDNGSETLKIKNNSSSGNSGITGAFIGADNVKTIAVLLFVLMIIAILIVMAVLKIRARK